MVVSQEQQKQEAVTRYVERQQGSKAGINQRRGGSAEATSRGYMDGLSANVHRSLRA